MTLIELLKAWLIKINHIKQTELNENIIKNGIEQVFCMQGISIKNIENYFSEDYMCIEDENIKQLVSALLAAPDFDIENTRFYIDDSNGRKYIAIELGENRKTIITINPNIIAIETTLFPIRMDSLKTSSYTDFLKGAIERWMCT